MASYLYTPPESVKRSDLRLIAPLPSGEKLVFGRQIPSNSKMMKYLTQLLKIKHAIHSFRIVTEEKDDFIYIRHLEVLIGPKFDVSRFINMKYEEPLPYTGDYNGRLKELESLHNYTESSKALRALMYNLRSNRRFFEPVTNKI